MIWIDPVLPFKSLPQQAAGPALCQSSLS
jgi:hypothetical protein